MTNTNFPLRRVRSFVRRDSRITDAQRRALELIWPRVGLPFDDQIVNFSKVFEREAPRILEIGFGSGYSLLEMAKLHPEQDFIGIEMHQPGIGTLLLGIEAVQLTNVRVYYADAVEVLTRCIADNSLDVIQIFFPDPWPKRKHHKRRLIQSVFIELVVSKLKPGGTLHLATDWQHYAEHMMAVLSGISSLKNLAGAGQYANRSAQRPLVTKFERRGTQSGRSIWELQFIK
ncbi:MAG: tRNA (guanosine(46)-N7)-methyltransferase TrmB [Gammaproteobacteria bacterium]